MSKRKLCGVAGVASVLTGSFLLLPAPRGDAMLRSDGTVWGGTDIGVRIPLPLSLDSSRIVDRPRYSPSGRYLAIRLDAGRPVLLDLVSGAVVDIYDRVAVDRPNMQCAQAEWLSEQELWVLELSASTEQIIQSEVQHPLQHGGWRYRVIDWGSGAVLHEQYLGNDPEFAFVKAEVGGAWVVRNLRESDYKRRFWMFHGPSSFDCVLFECTDQESLRFDPIHSWIPKLLVPLDSNPGAVEIDIEFVNYQTGQIIRVDHVPPLPAWGPQIAPDGAFIVTSTYHEVDRRWMPIVIEAETGARYELSERESWIPVAASESRRVMLVALINVASDGSTSTDWAEISFDDLIIP